jgi:5-methylcytosine-specific restriction protein A
MLELITKEEDIVKYQELLEQSLKKFLTKKGNFPIGYQGGSWNADINYNSSIWYSTFLYEDSQIHRFWNGFGLSTELDENKSNFITVEINIAKKTSRHVRGAFVIDEQKNIILTHRGRLTKGGYKFLEWYEKEFSQDIRIISDGKKSEKIIVVGEILENNFINKLEIFIKRIILFKGLSTNFEEIEIDELPNTKLNEIIKGLQDRKIDRIEGTVNDFKRNPYVIEFAKRQANGKCHLCNCDAPFENNYDEPYLEVHHIEWLSKGGSDIPNNVVALCPNCHRKMHILNLDSDIKKLKQIANSYNF